MVVFLRVMLVTRPPFRAAICQKIFIDMYERQEYPRQIKNGGRFNARKVNDLYTTLNGLS